MNWASSVPHFCSPASSRSLWDGEGGRDQSGCCSHEALPKHGHHQHPPTLCSTRSVWCQCHQPHLCPDATHLSDQPSITLASCSTRSSLTTSSSSLLPCRTETGSALPGSGTSCLQTPDRQRYLQQNNEHLLEVSRCVSNNISLQVSLVGWWKRERSSPGDLDPLNSARFPGLRKRRAAPALPQPSPSL